MLNLFKSRKLFSTLCCQLYKNKNQLQKYSQAVLGIETSCDDTGAAVIDGATGRLLGDALAGQQRTHTLHGGIEPFTAQTLHQRHIHSVVQGAMQQAGLHYRQLAAVAATVKPGLSASLVVGMNYGKTLALDHGLPFIPIHHMEAHTLTVRMTQQVPFPFLCLLASGGHCLLVLCKDIDDYRVLGSSLDDAPGEALDKGGRYLNLRSLRRFIDMSGGAAIEELATHGNPHAYNLGVSPLSQYRDCNFSFSGLKCNLQNHVKKLEEEHGIYVDTVLPEGVLVDLCASYQHAIIQHITRRAHRAMLYLEQEGDMRDGGKTLVVSGGVASNQVLRSWLDKLCSVVGGWSLVCPPPLLCTDNGVMIAWNGVERLRADKGVIRDTQQIQAVNLAIKCPLGEDISNDVISMSIKVKWMKM